MVEPYYQNKKVAVTGGLGFIGSNLSIELVRLGAKVTVIDPMIPLYGGNLYNVESIKNKVDIHYDDIRDKRAMEMLVKDQDVIFHIGNQTSHIDSMTDPFLDVDINCRGNLVFLEACRKENPEVKIVYAGSRAQYGCVESTPVDEEAPIRPIDIYGVNKHAGELYHRVYHKVYGLRTTALRLTNTYGPRHQMKHSRYGIQNWIIRLALDDEKIPIYGDGLQLRDYNYVDDVIDAFLRVGCQQNTDGETYNLGGGQPISFREMVEKVVKIADSGKIVFAPWPDERKHIEVGNYIADYQKIKKTVGWSPRVGFEEGLEKTIRFYRKYKKYYW
ncbi:GDP-mannose 4,6-dehydratase [bacterium]|nr:GDP-mannose 4,6-dehydratase [bacterium]